MSNHRSEVERAGGRSLSLGFARACCLSVAVVYFSTATAVTASDKPIINKPIAGSPTVINGHTVGETFNTPTAESDATPDDKKSAVTSSVVSEPVVVAAASQTKEPDRQEVYWGYVTPSKVTRPRFRRSVRSKPLWAYKPQNKRYTPRPQRDYRPKLDWTYHPKQSFQYRPKSDWTYHPAH